MAPNPPLKVLAETPEWIGIAKPEGLSIESIRAFLKTSYPTQKFAGIYSLDSAIAGPTVFAKSIEARNTLKNAYGSYQFSFVFEGWGASEKLLPTQWGCDLSIAWDPQKNRAYPSKKRGKKALTHFEIQQAYPPYYRFTAQTTYLRSQQLPIHAHFSHLDIIGDPLSPKNLPAAPTLQLLLRSVTFEFGSQQQTLQIDRPPQWEQPPYLIKS